MSFNEQWNNKTQYVLKKKNLMDERSAEDKVKNVQDGVMIKPMSIYCRLK